ncbi:hypothetical protein ACIQXG_05350 [Lysinibacillus sphaericus]|uniref:hypothetical protein n=1 Tax=Lysinibacillus sphaericus TaxID=1421 RepID=UPI00382AC4EB
MKVNSNLASMVLFICTLLLFFIISSSATYLNFFITYFHFHPLSAVLLMTITCFFLALIGLKDVKNIQSLLLSFILITLTLIFAGIISFTLFIGHMFS